MPGDGGNSFLVHFGVWPRTKCKSATSFKTAQEKTSLWKVASIGGSQSYVYFCAGPGPCLLGTVAKGISK